MAVAQVELLKSVTIKVVALLVELLLLMQELEALVAGAKAGPAVP